MCRAARLRRCASTTVASPKSTAATCSGLACTHGDVIKAIVADALGTHLDSFQRITADTASMSVIRYTALRPFVVHVNHTGDQLASGLSAKPPENSDGEAKDVPPSDAVVGGSTD